MKSQIDIVYFNNCYNRDHIALFGSGAFFDLGTTGRQAKQARSLDPGQVCVVAERAPDNQIVFDWYSFKYESILPNEVGIPDRVFFGRFFASEKLPKEEAVRSKRYAALFTVEGHLKIGSVFYRSIPSDALPADDVEPTMKSSSSSKEKAGAGFGDPAENKLVEMAAIRATIDAYESKGWSVRSRERDKCGFDLECSKGGVIENVEVKGVRGTIPCFIITAGEVEQAKKNSNFHLIVVTAALSASPKLTKFSGREFSQQFELSAIQFRAVLKS